MLPASWGTLVAICAMLMLSMGCADGPGFHLRKLNPMVQQEWAKDREKSIVFSQRQQTAAQLRSQIATMSDAEQQRWVEVIDKMAAEETSPEMRRESILTLEKVAQRRDAMSAIVKLSHDKSSKVRLAVADALRETDQSEATQTLLAMAQSDNDKDVRMKALESLGKHRTDEVKQFLAKQLEDRSPVVQYQATLALKDLTGKDLDPDVDAWKRYLAGENVERTTPSMAEYLYSYWPLKR